MLVISVDGIKNPHPPWASSSVCQAAKMFCERSPLLPELRYLRVGGNKLGAEGARVLAQAIRSSSQLLEIDLGSNRIGDEVRHKRH